MALSMLVDAVTDVPCGVLQNDPKNGEAAEVCMVGISKVYVAAAINAGVRINGGTNGRATAAGSAAICVGQMIQAGVADSLGSASVNCLNPTTREA